MARGKKRRHRLLRESIFHTEHALRKLRWTQWRLCMRDKAPPRNQREGVWEERNHGRPGMKCATLYRNTAGDPAIYEFAVRRIKDLARRKTVVYHKVHGGFEGKPWDSTLLKGDRCADEIDDVVENGCELWVRRAPIPKKFRFNKKNLKSLKDFRKVCRQEYDYGWRMGRTRFDKRIHHRQISVQDVTVSHGDIARKKRSKSRTKGRRKSKSRSKSRRRR